MGTHAVARVPSVIVFRRAAAFVLFCFPAAPHMYVCVCGMAALFK